MAINVLTVYRHEHLKDEIKGENLTADVKDGCLIILAAGVVYKVYSPQQWVTLNVEPIKR